MNKMEEYTFYADQHGRCYEKCNVLDNGTMIGSVNCQECKYCVRKDQKSTRAEWIVCSRINEAIIELNENKSKTQ